jgi:2-methylisocitrate lyase-like PEP mutase family enzyme
MIDSRVSLDDAIAARGLMPFIGIYDAFSASIVAHHYDALFVSGFGFAASHYGMPDIGFGTWTDTVDFVRRLRSILPNHYVLVDIDDGFCDVEVAVHTVKALEAAGASAVMLEDQRRPRRCGHFNGKQLLELGDYTEKLERVLAARDKLFVIARTDSADRDDIFRRVEAFAATGADAILVDGLSDLSMLSELRDRVGLPVAFNQISGGKSPAATLSELRNAGASIAIYSTPALFAAQHAIERAMFELHERDGRLPQPNEGAIGVTDCTGLLTKNLDQSVMAPAPSTASALVS